MALITHGYFPRSMFDMDSWFTPTLDIFDPFDDLDHMLGRNLEWLTIPTFMKRRQPRVPRKYRITLDCAGYNPKSIKTEIQNNKLILYGKEEDKNENGDYSTKEFRKSYNLPENAEVDKLVSFMTRNGHLVVEVPLKVETQSAVTNTDDLFPKLVESNDGKKYVTMNCSVPTNIDPSKLTVTCKDRDIIIKAEENQETNDTKSRMYYYKRCTMPENTDFNSLKCHYENGQLSIQAPLNPALENNHRQIPIEFEKN